MAGCVVLVGGMEYQLLGGGGVQQGVARADRWHWDGQSLTQVLVVSQIATSLLLLVGAGLFVRTLSNLQSVSLGFNPDNVLLFELNAPQAGHQQPRVADFYADLPRRLSDVPGVRDVTLSHASLIRAGRAHPVTRTGLRPGRCLLLGRHASILPNAADGFVGPARQSHGR